MLLKRLVAALPPESQSALRRIYYRRQIRRGSFIPGEREILRLGEWLKPGDPP